MTPSVVLDTNILVSAMLTVGGNPSKILEMVLDEELSVYYSRSIMSEYEDVLFRPRFAFDAERVHFILDAIRESGVLLAPDPSGIQLPDESDRVFYDAAKSGGALLITGNLRHYPPEPFIVTAAGFLAR
jgi:putative PIN family toxin of toxin-antitoxin system